MSATRRQRTNSPAGRSLTGSAADHGPYRWRVLPPGWRRRLLCGPFPTPSVRSMGKTVLITGSSSGIGRAVQAALERFGSIDVVINNAGCRRSNAGPR